MRSTSSILTKMLNLPVRLSFKNNLSAIVEQFDIAKDLDNAYSVVEKCKYRGGLGVDEVPNVEYFMKHLRSSYACTVKDLKNNNLMAILTIRPGPIARSITSPSHAGYIIVNPDYSRHGIGKSLLESVMNELSLKSFGYAYLVGRTSLLNPSIHKLGQTNMKFLGVIPLSTYNDKEGWVDDVICYIDYRGDASLPPPAPLPRPAIPPTPFDTLPYARRHHQFKCGLRAEVRAPQESEFKQISHLFREVSDSSEAIAVDEFDDAGNVNFKMIQKMNYIVLCNPEPIAAVVYGPSMFCRTNNPQMLGLYAVVAKNWQRQGIGMEFCRLCLDHLSNLGYAGVLADPFVWNSSGIGLALRLGFKVTASVPCSGVLKNGQIVDALLMRLLFMNYVAKSRL